MITPRIDWLTVSAHYSKGMEVPANSFEAASLALTLAADFESDPVLEEMPKQAFYTYCFRSMLGAIYRFGETEAQGFGYVLSGSVIGACGGSDAVCKVFETHHKRHLAKATRVDVSFDFEGNEFESVAVLGALYQAWRGEQKGAKPKRMDVRGSDGVLETTAFGSRSSEKYMRVYDKAREQVQEGKWSRLEIEVKGDSARAFTADWRAFALAQLDGMTPAKLDYAHDTWAGIVKAMKAALGQGIVATPRRTISRDEGDTLRWWKTAVAGTYKRLLKDNPELAAEMMQALLDAEVGE